MLSKKQSNQTLLKPKAYTQVHSAHSCMAYRDFSAAPSSLRLKWRYKLIREWAFLLIIRLAKNGFEIISSSTFESPQRTSMALAYVLLYPPGSWHSHSEWRFIIHRLDRFVNIIFLQAAAKKQIKSSPPNPHSTPYDSCSIQPSPSSCPF